MPIVVARPDPGFRIARVARSIAPLVAAAILSAACDGNGLSSPDDASFARNAEARSAGPDGLEQRLTSRLDPAPPGSPYTGQLTVTTTIINTGSAPVRLTARECLLTDADVETTARMDRFEPAFSCGAVSSTGDLAPGASSSRMQVQFGVRSGPGTYTLRIRHALSPEFRGELSFRIP